MSEGKIKVITMHPGSKRSMLTNITLNDLI